MKKLSMVMALTILFVCGGCKLFKPETKIETGTVSGNISISGAFALYPITVKWAEEFRKLYPEVEIDISAGGAGKGMADALSEMVDLGMFSREIAPQEKEKGAWHIALTKDAVLATVNASNPHLKEILEKGVSREKLRELYVSGGVSSWGELLDIPSGAEITLFTRSDACGAAAMWAAYLGVNQEDLLGLGIFGDPGVADAVRNNRYGIGYNNVAYIYDISTRKKYENLEVLPLDLDSNGFLTPDENFYSSLDSVVSAIKGGIYPSPPARELYFVSQGKPRSRVVILFIEWILTEGQQYLKEAGYVSLSEEKIAEEIQRLHL
ncbi:MAG: PstS family phosphate ABC transporter substrate-binding protein [Bacteroidales bacterium]|nr:PstS family phosphate ABC transporter substrate-binding protein [Bacteroidales bacterium]